MLDHYAAPGTALLKGISDMKTDDILSEKSILENSMCVFILIFW